MRFPWEGVEDFMINLRDRTKEMERINIRERDKSSYI